MLTAPGPTNDWLSSWNSTVCRCRHGLIDTYGYGSCQKRHNAFGRKYVCYVNYPSACSDAPSKNQYIVDGLGNWFQLSAEACKSNYTIKIFYFDEIFITNKMICNWIFLSGFATFWQRNCFRGIFLWRTLLLWEMHSCWNTKYLPSRNTLCLDMGCVEYVLGGWGKFG